MNKISYSRRWIKHTDCSWWYDEKFLTLLLPTRGMFWNLNSARDARNVAVILFKLSAKRIDKSQTYSDRQHSKCFQSSGGGGKKLETSFASVSWTVGKRGNLCVTNSNTVVFVWVYRTAEFSDWLSIRSKCFEILFGSCREANSRGRWRTNLFLFEASWNKSPANGIPILW